jgi:hypothetical protein
MVKHRLDREKSKQDKTDTLVLLQYLTGEYLGKSPHKARETDESV